MAGFESWAWRLFTRFASLSQPLAELASLNRAKAKLLALASSGFALLSMGNPM